VVLFVEDSMIHPRPVGLEAVEAIVVVAHVR
jgi:hypothetical protein